MKKLVACLVCLTLTLALGQPTQAQPRGGGSPPTAPADPIFAARDAARQQLRPLVASLRLNEYQALSIEQLLVAEALAPGTVPARTQMVHLLLAAGQLDRAAAAPVALR